MGGVCVHMYICISMCIYIYVYIFLVMIFYVLKTHSFGKERLTSEKKRIKMGFLIHKDIHIHPFFSFFFFFFLFETMNESLALAKEV